MVDKEYEEDQEENPESKVQFLQCVFCEDFHLKITDFFTTETKAADFRFPFCSCQKKIFLSNFVE